MTPGSGDIPWFSASVCRRRRTDRIFAYHEEDLRIGAGATLSRTVVLKPAGIGVAPSLWRDREPRIEARGKRVPDAARSRVTHAIPTGASACSIRSGRAGGVADVAGERLVNSVSDLRLRRQREPFLIDGTNFTCPCLAKRGRSRGSTSFRSPGSFGRCVGRIREHQGTVFNVVTRQGRDRFRTDASSYGQSGLTSQPVDPVPGSQSKTRNERANVQRFDPIPADRRARPSLVFRRLSASATTTASPARNRRFPRKYEQDKFSASSMEGDAGACSWCQSFTRRVLGKSGVPDHVTPFDATQRRTLPCRR